MTARLRVALARLQPAKLFGFGLRLLRVGVVTVTLAALLLVLGSAVSAGSDQFGFHPDKNTRVWADLAPVHAQSALCQQCHPAESAILASARHKGVACESCHGPLAAHAADAKVPVAPVSRSNEACAVCHTRVLGRPAAFPQHDPNTHYISKSCLQCHSAHSTTPTRPPRVVHSLANLPECTICHGPQGMLVMPAGHDVASDGVCLGCHGPGPARP